MTIKDIANQLNISERTVYRDLHHLEKILITFDVKIKSIPGKGIQIKGAEVQLNKLRKEISNIEQIDFTPKERRAIILSILYQANEPIKILALANELHVTNATISNDLSVLEKDLAPFQLELVRKRGLGVELQGNEVEKRKAISHLISKFFDPYEYITIAKENLRQTANNELSTISDRLLNFVNQEALSVIEDRVQKLRNEFFHDMADSAYVALVVHLALAIKRLQNGEYITFGSHYLKELSLTDEYKFASRLIKDLESDLEMEIPIDEIGYITMHLLGAKLHIDHNYYIEESSLDIAFIAQDLIDFISNQVNVNLSDNDSLLNDLVAHLKPAIYRIQKDMNIKNPLLGKIKVDYKDLFHLVEQGVNKTFPCLIFPDDEIGYLTLHFASALLNEEAKSDIRALVICSSGIGTAKILETQLIKKVPEITRIENRSMFEIDMETNQYDLIISTVPLHNYKDDYILVSPILSKSEVSKIKSVLRKNKMKKMMRDSYLESQTDPSVSIEDNNFFDKLKAAQKYSQMIVKILDFMKVKRIEENLSLYDLLTQIIHQLQEDSILVNSNMVTHKLIKRSNVNGLGIPGTSIALYHTRMVDIIKPIFTVYSLKHTIAVRAMDNTTIDMDTLIIMLAPEDADGETLEVLSFLSSILIQYEEAVSLFKSGDEQKLRQFLSKKLYGFLSEKLSI